MFVRRIGLPIVAFISDPPQHGFHNVSAKRQMNLGRLGNPVIQPFVLVRQQAIPFDKVQLAPPCAPYSQLQRNGPISLYVFTPHRVAPWSHTPV